MNEAKPDGMVRTRDELFGLIDECIANFKESIRNVELVFKTPSFDEDSRAKVSRTALQELSELSKRIRQNTEKLFDEAYKPKTAENSGPSGPEMSPWIRQGEYAVRKPI